MVDNAKMLEAHIRAELSQALILLLGDIAHLDKLTPRCVKGVRVRQVGRSLLDARPILVSQMLQAVDELTIDSGPDSLSELLEVVCLHRSSKKAPRSEY